MAPVLLRAGARGPRLCAGPDVRPLQCPAHPPRPADQPARVPGRRGRSLDGAVRPGGVARSAGRNGRGRRGGRRSRARPRRGGADRAARGAGAGPAPAAGRLGPAPAQAHQHHLHDLPPPRSLPGVRLPGRAGLQAAAPGRAAGTLRRVPPGLRLRHPTADPAAAGQLPARRPLPLGRGAAGGPGGDRQGAGPAGLRPDLCRQDPPDAHGRPRAGRARRPHRHVRRVRRRRHPAALRDPEAGAGPRRADGSDASGRAAQGLLAARGPAAGRGAGRSRVRRRRRGLRQPRADAGAALPQDRQDVPVRGRPAVGRVVRSTRPPTTSSGSG